MASHDRGGGGSAEYPRIASRRKVSSSTPTLDKPFSSSWIPNEVSVSPVRLETNRRVTNRKAQQHEEYSTPTNWSSVLSSRVEYTHRAKPRHSLVIGQAPDTSNCSSRSRR